MKKSFKIFMDKLKKHALFSVFTLFFTVGVIAGSVHTGYSNALKNDLSNILSGYVVSKNGAGDLNTFFTSLLLNAIPFVLVLLLSLTVFGFLCIGIIPFFKGFSAGFTVACLCSQYGLGGLLFCALCILPTVLVTAIVLLLLCVQASNMSYAVFEMSRAKKTGSALNKKIFLRFFVCILVVPVSALIDTFIVPMCIGFLGV